MGFLPKFSLFNISANFDLSFFKSTLTENAELPRGEGESFFSVFFTDNTFPFFFKTNLNLFVPH